MFVVTYGAYSRRLLKSCHLRLSPGKLVDTRNNSRGKQNDDCGDIALERGMLWLSFVKEKIEDHNWHRIWDAGFLSLSSQEI